MVCEKAAGAVDRIHARGDGLVKGYGAGAAVMRRRAGLISFAMLPLSLFALAVRHLVLLLEACSVPLFVNLPITVIGAAPAVKALSIHRFCKTKPKQKESAESAREERNSLGAQDVADQSLQAKANVPKGLLSG